MVNRVRRAVVASAALIAATAVVCRAVGPATQPTEAQEEAMGGGYGRMESKIADLRAQLRQQRTEVQRTRLELLRATASFQNQLNQVEADLRQSIGNARPSTQRSRS